MWLIGRYTEQRTRERWQALTPALDPLPRRRSRAADPARLQPRPRAGGAIADGRRAVPPRDDGHAARGFLSGSVLELAATLGVALVAVDRRRASRGRRHRAPGRADGARARARALPPAAAGSAPSTTRAPTGSRWPTGCSPGRRASGGDAREPACAEPGDGAVAARGASRTRIRRGPARCSTASTSSSRRARQWHSSARAGREEHRRCPAPAPRRSRRGGRIMVGEYRPRGVRSRGVATAGGLGAAAPDAPARHGRGQHPARRSVGFGRQRVRAAAALAGADGFVEALPDGYETIVGDGGRPRLGRRAPANRARAGLPPRRAARHPRRADRRPRPAKRARWSTMRSSGCDRSHGAADRAPARARATRRSVVDALDDRAAAAGGEARDRAAAYSRSPDAIAGRLALSVLLGALTVLFGVGLMATAGYLISRAAERPAILSLTVAIVARAVLRPGPAARALPRAARPRTTSRSASLAHARSRLYERIEPLAPGRLEGYRKGDLLSRMVADVDALQNLHLRVMGPPLVALVAGAVAIGVAAAFVPGPRSSSPAASSSAASPSPPCRRRWPAGGQPPGGGTRRAVGRARRAPQCRPRARGLRTGGRQARPCPGRGRRARAPVPVAMRSRAASPTVSRCSSSARPSPASSRRGLGARRRGSRQDDDRDARPPRPRVVRGRPATLRGGTGAVRDARARVGGCSRSWIVSRLWPIPTVPAPPPPSPLRARARGRQRPLRARGGSRARRRQPSPRARAANRAGWRERVGQDDGRQSRAPLPRSRAGARDARRPRPARAQPG